MFDLIDISLINQSMLLYQNIEKKIRNLPDELMNLQTQSLEF